MLKMPSFGMNTRPETFYAKPCQTFVRRCSVHRRHELMSVGNVSMHASMPNVDILAFNVTQEYTCTQPSLYC